MESEESVLTVTLNENETSVSKLQRCDDSKWQACVSLISNIDFYVRLFDYNLII